MTGLSQEAFSEQPIQGQSPILGQPDQERLLHPDGTITIEIDKIPNDGITVLSDTHFAQLGPWHNMSPKVLDKIIGLKTGIIIFNGDIFDFHVQSNPEVTLEKLRYMLDTLDQRIREGNDTLQRVIFNEGNHDPKHLLAEALAEYSNFEIADRVVIENRIEIKHGHKEAPSPLDAAGREKLAKELVNSKILGNTLGKIAGDVLSKIKFKGFNAVIWDIYLGRLPHSRLWPRGLRSKFVVQVNPLEAAANGSEVEQTIFGHAHVPAVNGRYFNTGYFQKNPGQRARLWSIKIMHDMPPVLEKLH
ncbi:MAG TPA: hypothetical protein ENI23_03935 [bacterium]|nr:hypothetical protein [bacterium]